MPCSRHYDILAKTRSRMTTATTFSRQNDVGSRARAHYLVLGTLRSNDATATKTSPKK